MGVVDRLKTELRRLRPRERRQRGALMGTRRRMRVVKAGIRKHEPPRTMQISTEGLALIEEFEGFPNNGRPYNDPVGHATVGFGHLLHFGPVTASDRDDIWLDRQARRGQLTRAEARHLLRVDLSRSYEPAVRQLGVPLTQSQYDALVSFVFNVGTGAIGSDTGIGAALRARNYPKAASELLRWDKAGSPPRPLAGLTRRRRAERDLFLKEMR
jgi:lysozyme